MTKLCMEKLKDKLIEIDPKGVLLRENPSKLIEILGGWNYLKKRQISFIYNKKILNFYNLMLKDFNFKRKIKYGDGFAFIKPTNDGYYDEVNFLDEQGWDFWECETFLDIVDEFGPKIFGYKSFKEAEKEYFKSFNNRKIWDINYIE